MQYSIYIRQSPLNDTRDINNTVDSDIIAKQIREEEEADRQRYQANRKEYDTHKHGCTAAGCAIKCEYFPEGGSELKDGSITYDDPDLDPSFYGYGNAMEHRRKIAKMTTPQYQIYRQKIKQEMEREYTEETKKAIAAGERLYVKSGIYPPWDDPKNNPNAKYYEYKKE